MLFRTLAAWASLFIASAASAQMPMPMKELEVKDVWAQATIGNTTVAAVYLSIMSPTPDRLLSASAPVADKVDLMTMKSSGGVMSMSYVETIDVPANKAVMLTPDGLHVWLAGLKEPLKVGTPFPLTLTFEKAGNRAVSVSVLPPGSRGPMNMNMEGMKP
jgi:periplasmic copper chaperone A